LFRKGTKGVLEELQAAFMRLVKWLEDVFGVKLGFEKKALDNILGEGLYGGKILSKTELEDWAKLLKKKYGTKLQKVDKFENPKVLAAFDGNTNTIKYTDEVTEYFIRHESFHAEEFSKIGKDAYFKGAHIEGTPWTIENFIHQYKRERYVYDRIVETAKTYKYSPLEVNIPPNGHAFQYFDTLKANLEVLLAKNNLPFPN
jgi:hypothetical protein